MSQENVEIVRAMNAAYASGDVQAALEALDPKIEWRGTVGGLDEHAVARGREEVIGAFADNLATWESLELDYEKYIDAGDQVVVFVHEVARGRESGAEIETDTAVVFTLQGGKIVRARAYMERAQALEAAGLSE
jgi:ketosteroid isomerase-like protein